VTTLARDLDGMAATCSAAAVPDHQVDRDALIVAAMRLGNAVLALAQRILEAQAELDADGDRRPYPRPNPPKPPADPKPKG
jgi:hypothetical protein